ncbi:hypothetical protein [Tritonibacter mobilis]|uniref:hypothetical protein n=1 Tax=Tritonibacter mobilis TaxID=379347 RepID=UPI000E0DC2B4|nr:hypothetical protein [Tritonibacter mobilis]
MDDDDENHDKGRKTNADRDFKPMRGKRQGFAPRGMVGRPPAGAPSREQTPPQQTQRPEPAAQTNKPYAVKTGVAAIDKQSIADGYQLKTEAELKAMAQGEKKQLDRPRVSQSAFAKSFRQARGPAPQAKPKGPEPE